MKKLNSPIAWINENGEVTNNEIQMEYWRISGKKISNLGFYVNIDQVDESLRAIRYGIKNSKPVDHIVNDLINYIGTAIDSAIDIDTGRDCR
jgi:tRNA A58 N-methylase Trm61